MTYCLERRYIGSRHKRGNRYGYRFEERCEAQEKVEEVARYNAQHFQFGDYYVVDMEANQDVFKFECHPVGPPRFKTVSESLRED